MTCRVCGKRPPLDHNKICDHCWFWAYDLGILVDFDELWWRYSDEPGVVWPVLKTGQQQGGKHVLSNRS
jgi:hypothetical protein